MNLALYGKWVKCCNDVMNNVDCVIKRDVFPQKKMHSCSKNVRGISVFVLKISVVYKKICIISVIAWLFLKDDLNYTRINCTFSTRRKR